MSKLSHSTLTLALAAALLTGCGSDLLGDSDATLDDAGIRSTVTTANINYYNVSSTGSGTTAGTHRWVAASDATSTAIAVYIPTPANSTETDLANKVRNAIGTYNRKLAGLVTLTEVSSAPASGGYLRVSYLTSYVPTGSTNYSGFCANVSTGANQGDVVFPDSTTGTFNNAVAWINLGNGHCDVTQDIVTHEVGHALGLGAHFNGFGDGDSISTAFWDVLATVYANPVNTTAAQLTIRRAAN